MGKGDAQLMEKKKKDRITDILRFTVLLKPVMEDRIVLN